MVYYPARVACDQDTAYHSKLASSNFELQEYKELKGIANPGKIYEFINSETQEDNSVTTFSYPMVGRDSEVKFFKDIIMKSQRELHDHNTMQSFVKGTILAKETITSKAVWMVVFEGENGIGKSRVLAACMTEAEKLNVQVFSVGMNLMMMGQTMFGLSSVIMDAIGIGGFRTSTEREDYLRKRVQESDLAAELCVINDILHTKFPLNPKYSNMESTATHTYGQHVLSALLKVFYPQEMILLAVDDAHFLDVSCIIIKF
jgi:adenylate cyclase 10